MLRSHAKIRLKSVPQKCDECDTSATLAIRERHKCDTSATRTTRGKISSYELPFGNASLPCQNPFKKCATKTKLFKDKSYIKKLYTRL